MKDVICQLADELCESHNLKVIGKHVKRILKRLKIVEKVKYVEVGSMRTKREECLFYAKVGKENNKFKEDLEIIIKPDHDVKRILRVSVQIGLDVYNKFENKDKGRWSSQKVFQKEVREIEKDLKEILKEAA